MLELLRSVAHWWHCIRYGLPVRIYSHWNVPMQGVPASLYNGGIKYVDCNTTGCLDVFLSFTSGMILFVRMCIFVHSLFSCKVERRYRKIRQAQDTLLFGFLMISSDSHFLIIIQYFPVILKCTPIIDCASMTALSQIYQARRMIELPHQQSDT